MIVGVPSDATSRAPSAQVATDALWLATLNAIAARSAHELRGALNGAAVNLEVVRSRAEKADAPAAAVRTFAGAAGEQLEEVIGMAEALLALARAGSAATDIGRVVRAVGSLLGRAARADGRELVIDGAVDALSPTTADANAVRLAIGAAMLAAGDASARVVCRGSAEGGEPCLRVELSGERVAVLADGVAAATRAAGIHVRAERSAISITFPR